MARSKKGKPIAEDAVIWRPFLEGCRLELPLDTSGQFILTVRRATAPAQRGRYTYAIVRLSDRGNYSALFDGSAATKEEAKACALLYRRGVTRPLPTASDIEALRVEGAMDELTLSGQVVS